MFDEPTNLPEGTSVELVSADTVVWWRPLDPSASRLPSNGSIDEDVPNSTAFMQQLTASIAEANAGETFDFAEVLAELRGRHTARGAPGPAVKAVVLAPIATAAPAGRVTTASGRGDALQPRNWRTRRHDPVGERAPGS